MIPPLPGKRHDARGFSLAEVVIALGVISFALVALIGLLTGGLQSGRESVEDVQAPHLASAILGQRFAAPVKVDTNFVLPPLNDSVKSPVLSSPSVNPYQGVTYLTRDGSLATSQDENYYRLDFRLSRDSSERLASVYISLVTPWQAVPPELQVPGPGQAVAKTRYETVTFIPVPK